jgi:hypothetical protein
MQKALNWVLFVVLFLVVFAFSLGRTWAGTSMQIDTHASGRGKDHNPQSAKSLVYTNETFRFRFVLPKSWQGYSIVVHKETSIVDVEGGPSLNKTETWTTISIRHPLWTDANPYQDIPIEVFTRAQWNMIETGRMSVTAAPFNPFEMGRNARYVFALPPRYNIEDAIGQAEVAEILNGNPLHAY